MAQKGRIASFVELFLGGYYYDSVSSSFLKLAGLTTVAAASASMFTGCGSLKPVTIVYIYEGRDDAIKTKVENLNKDKTKTTYIPLMSGTDYAKALLAVT